MYRMCRDESYGVCSYVPFIIFIRMLKYESCVLRVDLKGHTHAVCARANRYVSYVYEGLDESAPLSVILVCMYVSIHACIYV